MDEMKPRKEEKCRRRRNVTAICRETGDHVHYPPRRKTRSAVTRPPLPRQEPSPIFDSSFFQVTSSKPRYGQCRKNQAANLGITTYDGCGEFVSATAVGEDSLNCAACGCHRSFHEKESSSHAITENGVTETILDVLKISSYQFRQIFCSPYGDGGKALQGKKKKEPSRGYRIAVDRSGGEEEGAGRVKKLKTKFTAEQTEKMRNYAEKLLWKVRHESREEVNKFCVEIGVNRKNFRIWMNNHKDKN